MCNDFINYRLGSVILKSYKVTLYGEATVFVDAYDEDDAFDKAVEKVDEGSFDVNYDKTNIEISEDDIEEC